MGNQTSLTKAQIEEAKIQSDFTPEELNKLFRKFKRLDTDKSGTLSVEEFMAIPDLEHNPLVRRVVDTIDSNKSGEVDFIEFIQALSMFAKSSQKAEEEKYRFTFNLYDVDGDGYISNSDLFQILKAMVGNNLNDVQLQQLVDRTMRQGDKDVDGKLSYEEFLTMVKPHDLGDKLKLDVFGNSGSNGNGGSTGGGGARDDQKQD